MRRLGILITVFLMLAQASLVAASQSTYTYASGNGTIHFVYNGTTTFPPLYASGHGLAGTQIIPNDYVKVKTDDTNYLSCIDYGTNFEAFYRFNFTVAESPAKIKWIYINIVAQSTFTPTGEDAACYVANFSSNTWLNISTMPAAYASMTKNLSVVPANFVSNSQQVVALCVGKDLDSAADLNIDYVSVLVDYDTTAPTVTWVAPTATNGTESVNKTYVEFNVTVNENIGTCTFQVNSTNVTETVQVDAEANSYCYYNETGLTGNVTSCAIAYANDTLGNLGMASGMICRNTNEQQTAAPPDTTKPDVNWINPTTNGTENVNVTYVIFNISVNENIGNCAIEINGSNQTCTTIVNATTNSYGYYNKTGLTGNQTVCAWGYAADGNGNYNRTNQYICRNTNEQQPDVVKPELVWSTNLEANNSATAINKTYIFWNFTTTETIGGCNLEVNSTNQSGTVSGLTCYYNNTGLTGNVTRCAYGYANDTSGNLNMTAFRCVNTNEQQTCTPNLTNTTWTDWINMIGCYENNTLQQNRSLTMWDVNGCGGANTTYWEYQSASCLHNTYYLETTTDCVINASRAYSGDVVIYTCNVYITNNAVFSLLNMWMEPNETTDNQYTFYQQNNGVLNWSNVTFKELDNSSDFRVYLGGTGNITTFSWISVASTNEGIIYYNGSANMTFDEVRSGGYAQSVGAFHKQYIQNSANMTFNNSFLDGVYVHDPTGTSYTIFDNVSLGNSADTEYVFLDDNSITECGFRYPRNCKITRLVDFRINSGAGEVPILKGYVNFDYGVGGVSQDFGSTGSFQRYYPIFVYNEVDNVTPVSGITVQLKNETGAQEIIWSGTTDTNGQAYYANVTFKLDGCDKDTTVWQIGVYVDSVFKQNITCVSNTTTGLNYSVTVTEGGTTSPDVSWVSPTDVNGTETVNKTYIFWNGTASAPLANCSFEINGTNYTGSVSGTNCYYNQTGLTANQTSCSWFYANNGTLGMNVSQICRNIVYYAPASAISYIGGTHYWDESANCTVNVSVGYYNSTIIATCNITIENGAILTFNNVYFKLNETSDKQYSFFQTNNGILNWTNVTVMELDNGSDYSVYFGGTGNVTTFTWIATATTNDGNIYYNGSANMTFDQVRSGGYSPSGSYARQYIQNSANVTFNNSFLDGMYTFYPSGTSYTLFDNVTFGDVSGTEYFFLDDNSTTECGFRYPRECYLTRLLDVRVNSGAGETATLKGYVTFDINAPYASVDFGSTGSFRRYYPIFVYDVADGTTPLSGISVKLKNETGVQEILWSGTTDTNGRANYANVTFTRDGCDDDIGIWFIGVYVDDVFKENITCATNTTSGLIYSIASAETTPPNWVVFTSPTNANGTETVNKNYIYWNGSADVSLTACSFEINGTNQTATASGTNCYYNQTGLTGNVTKCAWLYASNGTYNRSTTYICRNTNMQAADTTPPNVNWIDPTTNGTEAVNKTYIIFNISVNEDIGNCKIEINGTNQTCTSYVNATTNSYGYYNKTGMTNNQTICAWGYASDGIGNYNRTTQYICRNVVYYGSSPTLSLDKYYRAVDLNSSLSSTISIQFTVSDATTDVILTWNNFTDTAISSNRTSWSGFQGTDTILLIITRNSSEIRSRDFNLTFSSTTSEADNISLIVTSIILKYPFVLFSNINETPGYLGNASGLVPYTTMASQLYSYTTSYHLPYEICGSEDDQSWRVFELAVTYQMTNNSAYANKTIEALYCLDPEKIGSVDRAWGSALIDYSLAYDFVMDYALKNNDSTIFTIRDKLASMANKTHYYIPVRTNHHDKIIMGSGLGVTSITLQDYDTDYATGPVNWSKAGIERMMVNETMNPTVVVDNRSFLMGYNNIGGLSKLGSYKSYWIYDFSKWSNIYQRHYGNLSSYSQALNIINEVLWITIPTNSSSFGSSSYIARSNVMSYGGLDYSYYFSNGVLSATDSGMHKTIVRDFLGENTTSSSTPERTWQYLVYNVSIDEVPINTTSLFSASAEVAIFRNGFNKDSDYLFLKLQNIPIASERNMDHNDQMSFDLYSKGDYLLPDSGEVKYRESGYGPVYAKGHNTIMISNGTSRVGGPVKGSASYTTMYDKATLTHSLISSNIDFVVGEILNWNKIENTNTHGEDIGSDITLSTPVRWMRTILYPNHDYFIIIDDINNTISRNITALFHLGSFNQTDSNSTFNGSVNGNLTVEGQVLDWKSQAYRTEIYNTSGNSIVWNTTNLTGGLTQLYLYSVPKADISVEKFWIRIGDGSSLANEVDHPIIRFTNLTSNPYHRITVVYTKHNADSERQISQLTVTGSSGDDYATKIAVSPWEDIVFAGDAGVDYEADWLWTDCGTAFARVNASGDVFPYKGLTCINGTDIKVSGLTIVHSNITLDYFVCNSTGVNFTCIVKNTDPANITFYVSNSSATTVRRNGVLLNPSVDWGTLGLEKIWVNTNYNSEITLLITSEMAGAIPDTTPPDVNWTTPTAINGSETANKNYITWNITSSESFGNCIFRINVTNYTGTGISADANSYCYYNQSIDVGFYTYCAKGYASDNSSNWNSTLADVCRTTNITVSPEKLLLNGTSGNVYYEHGSMINISSYGIGQRCININLTGYTNVNCSTNLAQLFFTTYTWDNLINSSLTENLSADSDLNLGTDRRFINNTFNITGFTNNTAIVWFYQENVTSYALNGPNWYSNSSIVDNSWVTSAYCKVYGGGTLIATFNYTVPANTTGAIWTAKTYKYGGSTTTNQSVGTCFNASGNQIQLKYIAACAVPGSWSLSCYNGADWVALNSGITGYPSSFYEEAVWWQGVVAVNTKTLSFDIDKDGTSDIVYPGYLIGGIVYQNESTDGETALNLTFTSPGTQSFDVYLPKNISILLNNITVTCYGGVTGQKVSYDFAGHHSDSATRLTGSKVGAVYCAGGSYNPDELDDYGYEAIWYNDSNYYETVRTKTSNGNCDSIWHYFRYNVIEPEDRINNITFVWYGYGHPKLSSDTVTLYIWNYTSGSWKSLTTGGVNNWTTLTSTETGTVEDLIDGGWLQYAAMIDYSYTAGDTMYLRSEYVNMTVNMNISLPSNLTFDTGFDTDSEWNFSGECNSSNSPITIDANITELQSHINDMSDSYDEVSMALSSESTGIVEVKIDIRYNLTNQVGFTGVNVTGTNGLVGISADKWGVVNINNVYNQFEGDIDYNISSNESWHYAFVRWSNISAVHPYTFTSNILWFAPSNSTKNLTPWSQSNSVSIYNISAARNTSIFISSRDLDNCLNLTVSNSSSKTNGYLMNDTLKLLLANITTGRLWFWLDLENCGGRWQDFNVTISKDCEQCSWWY